MKIVLAYSGGLDTSIIIPWLKEHYKGVEVIAYCGDLGQLDSVNRDEEIIELEKRAYSSGASKFYLRDLRQEFVKEYLFPLLRSGAVYEGKYLLGTSIARPLQAKHHVDIAKSEGAQALCHGCTGKGNDQVRFEMAYKALAPDLEIIAPWRIWELTSREEAIEYAIKHNIDLKGISHTNIYSRDSNIWHTSHEGGDLEDLGNRPKAQLYQRSLSPKDAPDSESIVAIEFKKSFPVALNGEKINPSDLISKLNTLGKENAIGRTDVIETRLVGMKSRGIYETRGGTILWHALREIESVNLDSEVLHYKQLLSLRYAELVYNGKWYSPLRKAIDHFNESISDVVNGTVTMALYKGNITVVSRESAKGLYNRDLASFSDGAYDHSDATGFINLYGLSEEIRARYQS